MFSPTYLSKAYHKYIKNDLFLALHSNFHPPYAFAVQFAHNNQARSEKSGYRENYGR